MKYSWLTFLQITFVHPGVIPSDLEGNGKVLASNINIHRHNRQSFLGDTDTPVIKFDPDNKVGSKANK